MKKDSTRHAIFWLRQKFLETTHMWTIRSSVAHTTEGNNKVIFLLSNSKICSVSFC